MRPVACIALALQTDTAIRTAYMNSQKPTIIEGKNGTLRRWLYATKSNLNMVPRIAIGVSVFSSGCVSTIYGSDEEAKREKALIVMSGIMKVTSGDKSYSLYHRDCAYIPAGVNYQIENIGYSDLKIAWTIAPSFDVNPVSEETSHGELKVLRTFAESAPVSRLEPGLERTIYRLDFPKNFRFALFTRKAHTYSPLHTHDPPDFEEGYIVLQGSLKLTDLQGKSSSIREGDFAYVPPFGGNFNENVENEEVHYLWVGAPGVSMKEIPIESKYTKLGESLGLKK